MKPRARESLFFSLLAVAIVIGKLIGVDLATSRAGHAGKVEVKISPATDGSGAPRGHEGPAPRPELPSEADGTPREPLAA